MVGKEYLRVCLDLFNGGIVELAGVGIEAADAVRLLDYSIRYQQMVPSDNNGDCPKTTKLSLTAGCVTLGQAA
jgi:hypothetical protein